MYGLLRNLLVPASPKDKLFKEIVDTLKAHFKPKPLVIAERFHFHRQNQNSGESVAMYVADFDVWLPIVLLKPIWRKRCVIVLSMVCAARVLSLPDYDYGQST